MNTEIATAEVSESEWQSILHDIKSERAVLLIGPEFMRYKNKLIHSHLRDELQKDNGNDISYYYERDGLFLFKDEGSKTRVVSTISRLYEKMTSDETILSRIAQLPFPLIISLTPDHFLTQYFNSKGIKHQFEFNNKEKKEVESPTANCPLIYNLFGSIEEDESLVLNYDDVCEMLEWTFKGNLPDKLLTFYQKARTCIFLGFQFDRWYSQLMLKFLNGRVVKGQQIAIKMPYNADSEAFIMSQFKVKFIGDQLDLLDEIHYRYESEHGLRVIQGQSGSEAPSATRKEIENLIIQSELKKALERLILVDSVTNESMMQMGALDKLEKDERKGIIHSGDAKVEWAKIRNAVLELAEKLPQ